MTQLSYTIPQAATLCGVTDKTIRSAIHAGHLRAKRLPGRYLIKADALEAWLDGLEDA